MAYNLGSDYQRSLVYSWDREVVSPNYPNGIPQVAVTLLIAKVEAVTGVPIAWEYNPRATRWAWGGKLVTLPNPKKATWAYNVSVVIHECTHVVLKAKGLCDQHGPKFMGGYIALLQNCGGSIGQANAVDWYLAAQARGIDITPRAKKVLEHNVPAEGFYHQGERS